MSRERRTRVVNILMTPEDHDRFREEAKREGIPAGTLAHSLVKKWMEQRDPVQYQPEPLHTREQKVLRNAAAARRRIQKGSK